MANVVYANEGYYLRTAPIAPLEGPPAFEVGLDYYADDGRCSALIPGIPDDGGPEAGAAGGHDVWHLRVFDHRRWYFVQYPWHDPIYRRGHDDPGCRVREALSGKGFWWERAVWTWALESLAGVAYPPTNVLCVYTTPERPDWIAVCSAWQPELRRLALQKRLGIEVVLVGTYAPLHFPVKYYLKPWKPRLDEWPWYRRSEELWDEVQKLLNPVPAHDYGPYDDMDCDYYRYVGSYWY